MVTALAECGRGMCEGAQFLRTYWYDAMPGPRLSLEQGQLALLPGVKIRLGALNNVGEQKGVDSLIVTDLIELARNGAVADAVLVSGDEDLRIAVELAQSFGVRVHILAAGEPSKNVSHSLQMEADSVAMLNGEWFAKQLNQTEAVQSGQSVGGAPDGARLSAGAVSQLTLEDAAGQVADELINNALEQLPGLKTHFEGSQSVPPEFDRKLIAKTAALIGHRLQGDELRKIRGVFVRTVRSRTV